MHATHTTFSGSTFLPKNPRTDFTFFSWDNRLLLRSDRKGLYSKISHAYGEYPFVKGKQIQTGVWRVGNRNCLVAGVSLFQNKPKARLGGILLTVPIEKKLLSQFRWTPSSEHAVILFSGNIPLVVGAPKANVAVLRQWFSANASAIVTSGKQGLYSSTQATTIQGQSYQYILGRFPGEFQDNSLRYVLIANQPHVSFMHPQRGKIAKWLAIFAVAFALLLALWSSMGISETNENLNEAVEHFSQHPDLQIDLQTFPLPFQRAGEALLRLQTEIHSSAPEPPFHDISQLPEDPFLSKDPVLGGPSLAASLPNFPPPAPTGSPAFLPDLQGGSFLRLPPLQAGPGLLRASAPTPAPFPRVKKSRPKFMPAEKPPGLTQSSAPKPLPLVETKAEASQHSSLRKEKGIRTITDSSVHSHLKGAELLQTRSPDTLVKNPISPDSLLEPSNPQPNYKVERGLRTSSTEHSHTHTQTDTHPTPNPPSPTPQELSLPTESSENLLSELEDAFSSIQASEGELEEVPNAPQPEEEDSLSDLDSPPTKTPTPTQHNDHSPDVPDSPSLLAPMTKETHVPKSEESFDHLPAHPDDAASQASPSTPTPQETTQPPSTPLPAEKDSPKENSIKALGTLDSSDELEPSPLEKETPNAPPSSPSSPSSPEAIQPTSQEVSLGSLDDASLDPSESKTPDSASEPTKATESSQAKRPEKPTSSIPPQPQMSSLMEQSQSAAIHHTAFYATISEEEAHQKLQELEEAKLHQLFEEYKQKRKECGESIKHLSYESFSKRIRKQRDEILERFQCKDVRFVVYEKKGRAALKATPIR